MVFFSDNTEKIMHFFVLLRGLQSKIQVGDSQTYKAASNFLNNCFSHLYILIEDFSHHDKSQTLRNNVDDFEVNESLWFPENSIDTLFCSKKERRIKNWIKVWNPKNKLEEDITLWAVVRWCLVARCSLIILVLSARCYSSNMTIINIPWLQ